MFKTKESRCSQIEDKDIIELNIDIKNIGDLLKNDGSIASVEESLSKAIEEYLFKVVKCYPISQRIKLLIIIKESKNPGNDDEIEEIVHSHFCYKVKETQIYLKEQFRQWGINFFIGILFLILCLIIGGILDKFSHISMIKIIKESLLIIGWVALWEPVSFILFGWRVINRDKNYYKKLCSIPIDVVEKRYINPVYIEKKQNLFK
ncbi:hypothetical protein [Clostridium sp.]|uniref:hypothetical protein n=1 Tax=Clostridium sp. TaxID=1506 RepID=UPI002FC98B20